MEGPGEINQVPAPAPQEVSAEGPALFKGGYREFKQMAQEQSTDSEPLQIVVPKQPPKRFKSGRSSMRQSF